MKNLIAAALALTLLGATAASAQPYRGNDTTRNDTRGRDNDRYDRNDRGDRNGWNSNNGRGDVRNGRGFQNNRHTWKRGQRFHARGPVVHVRDYRRYQLRTPPRGHHWVRYDNDYLLVAITSGIIADILFNRY
jgi:Ni/Co efflux regulator RcnB